MNKEIERSTFFQWLTRFMPPLRPLMVEAIAVEHYKEMANLASKKKRQGGE